MRSVSLLTTKVTPSRAGCRPNCYVQQWRGSNGEESAYCSKMCANNHTAGFKVRIAHPYSSPALVTWAQHLTPLARWVQDPTTRERDAIVSEFYGALNTAVSAEALNNLQKDWANTAVSLNLTDALLHEIQQVQACRVTHLSPLSILEVRAGASVSGQKIPMVYSFLPPASCSSGSTRYIYMPCPARFAQSVRRSSLIRALDRPGAFVTQPEHTLTAVDV